MAEEMDITEEELAAVRAMVMAVTAGRIFFQSKTVVEKMAVATTDAEDEPGCTPFANVITYMDGCPAFWQHPLLGHPPNDLVELLLS